MKINYCDKNILAAHNICMYHILCMHLSGIPKQILHKTNSFRQEQNRDLWRKTHCRTDTLLAIKARPRSLIPPLTLSLFLPLSQRTTFDSWCKKWQKQAHYKSLRNNRNSSGHKRTSKRVKKKYAELHTQRVIETEDLIHRLLTTTEKNTYKQESVHLADARNCREHAFVQCVKCNMCKNKSVYKEYEKKEQKNKKRMLEKLWDWSKRG